MARNQYPGVCYCCGAYVPVGFGHFERIRGGKGWRVKCVKCASGRIVRKSDPEVQRAERLAKQVKEKKAAKEAKRECPDRKCVMCGHLENMDYIHGCGECAALEGKTVVLTENCICPSDVLKDVEKGIEKNRQKCLGQVTEPTAADLAEIGRVAFIEHARNTGAGDTVSGRHQKGGKCMKHKSVEWSLAR